MANDLITILKEIRGTGAPEEEYTDGIYYDIVSKDYNGNPGLYGDIVEKHLEVINADKAIDAKVLESKAALDTYTTTDKYTQLDTYTTSKEGELNTHTALKEVQLDTHTIDKEGELDTYIVSTSQPAIDSYIINTSKPSLDTYRSTIVEPALDTYRTGTVEPALDSYRTGTVEPALDTYRTGTIEPAFDTHAAGKTTDFDNNAANKTTAYDDNHSNVGETGKLDIYNANDITKTTAYNDNHISKVGLYDSNATAQTTIYNENHFQGDGSGKLEVYDANHVTKLDTYNSNDTIKTTTYNDNHIAKVVAYDANDMAKLEEYNSNHTNKLAAVQGVLDNFQDQYLGSHVDNTSAETFAGAELGDGDLYWNSTSNEVRFYTGSGWEAPEAVASAAATTATTQAGTATTQAGIATTQATNASTSASMSQEWSEKAEDVEVTGNPGSYSSLHHSAKAEAAESGAVAAQGFAETAQGLAEGARDAAQLAETNAAASADFVDDLVLGAKASDPTLDNDGDALQEGALYYNTTNSQLMIYNGTSWDVAAFNTTGVVIDFNGRQGNVLLTAEDVNTALGFMTVELTKLNVDALSVDAGTVNSLTVETAVPVGALFTDTVYDDTALSTVVSGHTGLIAGNINSILQLAKSNTHGAFGTTGISLSVTSTPKVLPFSVITQSSNTDRFEINNDNTITAKVSGTYVFTSTINVEDTGGNGSVVPLTFNITDGTSVWHTEVVEVEISGYDRDTIAVNSLVILPPEAAVPANAYITVSCPPADNGDYTIVGFHSILSTEKSLAELQGLASSILVEAKGGLSESTLQYLLENLQSSIDVLESSAEADLSGLEV